MLEKRILLIALLGMLSGCSDTEISQTPGRESRTLAMPATVSKLSENRIKGEFRKNSTSMPIRDYVATWDEEGGERTIVQTPTRLTDDEKSRLANGENDFFVLVNKESPDENMVWNLQFYGRAHDR